MIHLFNSRGRILFFPVKWANAVSSWILGLHSPSGTIRVSNTANPSESGGASVDVDMEVVAAKTKEFLTGHFQTKREVEATIERAADGSSIVSRERRIHVSEDWLRDKISETAATVDSSAAISPVASAASAGSATKAAPSDHVHNLTTDDSLFFYNGDLGVVFGGSGSATSASHSDHDHDTEYAAKATETTASDAASDAADALAAANTASTNASEALTLAASASTSATEAYNAAIAAQSTATNASSVASSAASAVAEKLSKTDADNYYQPMSDKLTGIDSNSSIDDNGSHCMSGGVHYSGYTDSSTHSAFVYGVRENQGAISEMTTLSADMIDLKDSNSTRISSWIKTGTTNIDGSKVVYGTQSAAKVAEIGTDGKVSASSSTFAKFASTPGGSKFVTTSGTTGTLAEVSLAASKWMKTDASGNPSTTDDTPIAASKSASGIIYNAAGTISYKGIGTGSTEVAAGNHNHDSEYADINHNHSGVYATAGHGHSGYAASSHTHTYGDGSLNGFGASASKAFDADGGTMAYDSKLKTLANALSSDGKVNTSSLTCDVSGHQNTCLLIASGSTVTHSGNDMYNMLNAATEQTTKRATKIITDKDKPYIPGAYGGLLVRTTETGEIEESDDIYAAFTSEPSGSKLVLSSGSDGNLAEASLGNGLQISNSALSPKFATNGGITANANGLKLDSVGTKSKTLNLVEKYTAGSTSTSIALRLYGLEIDANGRVIGRTTSYTTLYFYPGVS